MAEKIQPAATPADQPDGSSASPEPTVPSASGATAPSENDATTKATRSVPKSTIAGRFWIVLGGAVVVAILLIIFIAENSQRVTIHFLGAKGSISAALALLIAAVAGAIIMLLVGTVRIVQLRGEVKHSRRRRRKR